METSRLDARCIDRHRLSHSFLHHLLHQRHARVILRRVGLLQVQLLHCGQREVEIALNQSRVYALRQTDPKVPAKEREHEEVLELPSYEGRSKVNATRRNRQSFGKERN